MLVLRIGINGWELDLLGKWLDKYSLHQSNLGSTFLLQLPFKNLLFNSIKALLKAFSLICQRMDFKLLYLVVRVLSIYLNFIFLVLSLILFSSHNLFPFFLIFYYIHFIGRLPQNYFVCKHHRLSYL